MPAPATKLRPPRPRRRLVPRPRLTGLLTADQQPRLILVAAPAGFGKTTLLTQWLQTEDARARVAWLTLDPGDGEVRRFLTQVVAAVRTAAPAVGAEALALLEAGGDAPPEAVLASLIDDLDVLPGPTVLVFDDYHVIEAVAVHEAVGFLLDNLPPQVTLAMTSRADPPLALSRLRARGELVEVRAADLRFTRDETQQFFDDVMDLALDPAVVDALETRTEGWAAGLQLAALSARTHAASGSIAGFVDAFSGSHRFVLDYLVEEVLDRQPQEVRAFLLDTCLLDQLTAGLCDAVTHGSGGQAMLERLERENLFVVALDDERRWYRYHHLFADALRARLAARDPGRAAERHGAAARWLAEHGLLEDAVGHALASGDHELAADLVELGLAELRRRRANRTLRDWLVALPEDVVRRRPLLALYRAWTRLYEGDIDGVEAWLDAVERGPEASAAPGTGMPAGAVADRESELRSVPAMAAVYRASVAQARGDIGGTVSHARRALTLAGPDDHFPRGAAAGFVGLAAWAAGDLPTAVDTFGDAVASLRAAGMIADALGGTVVLANLWLARGRPDRARRLYEQALAEAERRGPVIATSGDLHVGLADVLREAGDVDAATHHLELARGLGDPASVRENRHRWYTVNAALLRARRDYDGAAAMLDEAESLHLPGYFPDVRPIAATRARVRIAQGRLDAAWAWAREHGLASLEHSTYLAEYDQLTMARLLIADGRPREALPLLDRLLETARAAGREGSVIEAHLVRALAHHANDAADAAASDLATAVTSGVPYGYRRLFLDEGQPVLEVLARVAAPEAQILLSAARSPEAAARRPSNDELSDREREVLRLLATELSGPEIAQALYVSVNTLRTHTKHIFTKLGVNTRRAAVRRATELELL